MPYCSSCGMPIPEGQGSSCSMCYGDAEYGNDGYAREYLEEMDRKQQMQEEMERRQEEELENG